MDLNFAPLCLSLTLSLYTTVILFIIGLPLAWWLSRTSSRLAKALIESTIALPLVLPPTVLGFYLLLFLSESGVIGKMFGVTLAFRFSGLVIGSVFYSLPFVVQPLQSSFESIGTRPQELALTLGYNPWQYFWRVHLPLSRRGLLTAAVMGFAHTLGEFGVVLMIGGNIPGQTQVISIAIYDLVEQLRYDEAHVLALSMLSISFVVLTLLFIVNKKTHRTF